jgi:8-oxo-dGTP pyrophosphatase MutT (NUDIX family)
MDEARWRPNVTVAAVVERDGRYLLVEEHTASGLRLNNPAGHLERGETLLQAVQRETLEETACHFEPQALVGVYQARLPALAGDDPVYLRFAFCGSVGKVESGRALDSGIVRTLWLTVDEVRDSAARHRSPLVWRCIADHQAGARYPLQLIGVDPGYSASR